MNSNDSNENLNLYTVCSICMEALVEVKRGFLDKKYSDNIFDGFERI